MQFWLFSTDTVKENKSSKVCCKGKSLELSGPKAPTIEMVIENIGLKKIYDKMTTLHIIWYLHCCFIHVYFAICVSIFNQILALHILVWFPWFSVRFISHRRPTWGFRIIVCKISQWLPNIYNWCLPMTASCTHILSIFAISYSRCKKIQYFKSLKKTFWNMKF